MRNQPSCGPLMSALIMPVAISPQYECVHAIPRTPIFAPCRTNPLSSEPVEIQLQSVLQTNTLTWMYHSRLQVRPRNSDSKLAGKVTMSALPNSRRENRQEREGTSLF